MTWTTFAGAGALVERDGRVLMVRQRRHYGVHWELPSGYVEAGESFEQAAAREVLEEAAITVDVGDLSAVPRPQLAENIEDAAFLDPHAVDPSELHPLNQAVFDRRWDGRAPGFHVHASVNVEPGGTQSYAF